MPNGCSCIPRDEEKTTLTNKNMNFFFFVYYAVVDMAVWGERERVEIDKEPLRYIYIYIYIYIERERERESERRYLVIALLLRSAFTRLAQFRLKTFNHLSSFSRLVQGWLKTFNHLRYFVVLLTRIWYRSVPYRGLRLALVFPSVIIPIFVFASLVHFRLFRNS